MNRLTFKARLKRHGIACLYYMLPAENVPAVMRKGILSYNKAKSFPHRSFADESVQRRREHLIIPGANRHIHDYVPLYFTTHTEVL